MNPEEQYKNLKESLFLLLAGMFMITLFFANSCSIRTRNQLSASNNEPTNPTDEPYLEKMDCIPTPREIIRESTVPVPTVSEDILLSDITVTPSPVTIEISDEENEIADEPSEDLPVFEEDPDSNPDIYFYIYPDNNNEVCTYINVNSSKNVLLVGDSRTVGFYLSTGYEEFSYLAKGSMGYSWLVNGSNGYNPEQLIQEYINHNSSGKVVLTLGINDLGNLPKYEEWIGSFANKNSQTQFYYMSVNPVKGRSDLEPGISAFNTDMPTKLPSNVKWLDCYSYLMQEGFYAGDGVHYDVETYNKILYFLLENL